MSIKLIAIDLDGTLLNDMGKVQPQSIDTIKKAIKAGIKIVLATGRPLVSTKPLLKLLGLDNQDDQYVITFNGSIIETTRGKVIAEKAFKFQTFVDFELWAQKIHLYNQLEDQDALYTIYNHVPIDAAHESWKNKLPMNFVTLHDLIDSPNKPAMLKIMAVSDKNTLDNLIIPDEFKTELNPIRSEPCYMDFAAPNVDKGWALKQLTEHLGLTKDEVMAMGNADNDMPMVEFAGIGVAMQKSTPNLLKVANKVTGSNNESGISDAIEKYALEK